jgi:LysR family transcriptional regulator, glycine cleavage system transcriptional activator
VRRLPPFPELVAFEAVARRLSFTKAAAELCITQSAVSHRVSRLETFLGTQLLHRSNPGLALTAAGAALLPQLKAALDSLERLSPQRERRLRIAAASALCTWWLAGRLSAFMQQHPGITLELIPVDSDRSSVPEVDVRILWLGPGEEPSAATHMPLASEQVFPVCSPDLVRDLPMGHDAAALATLPLIHKAYHAVGEWSWSVWLERLGVKATKRREGELRFPDPGLMLSAAVNGAGVTLGRSLLAHDALMDGRLIMPFPAAEAIVSEKRHFARWRRDRQGDRDIEAFVSWLAAEAAASIQAVARGCMGHAFGGLRRRNESTAASPS